MSVYFPIWFALITTPWRPRNIGSWDLTTCINLTLRMFWWVKIPVNRVFSSAFRVSVTLDTWFLGFEFKTVLQLAVCEWNKKSLSHFNLLFHFWTKVCQICFRSANYFCCSICVEFFYFLAFFEKFSLSYVYTFWRFLSVNKKFSRVRIISEFVHNLRRDTFSPNLWFAYLFVVFVVIHLNFLFLLKGCTYLFWSYHFFFVFCFLNVPFFII